MQCAVGKNRQPELHLNANNKTVPIVPSLALLDVTSSPKWDHHIDNMTRKSNSKKYFLMVLKRAWVPTDHLLKFYMHRMHLSDHIWNTQLQFGTLTYHHTFNYRPATITQNDTP